MQYPDFRTIKIFRSKRLAGRFDKIFTHIVQLLNEAVFGDLKFNHSFKRFRLRSNRKANVEFGLVATAHNIRKYVTAKAEKEKRSVWQSAAAGLSTRGQV